MLCKESRNNAYNATAPCTGDNSEETGEVSHYTTARTRVCGRWRGGFTLLETMVALGVMGVAITIFVATYSSCLALRTYYRDDIIASELAEECLAELKVSPNRLDWSALAAAAPGELVRLNPATDTAAPLGKFEPPKVIPQGERDARSTRVFYNKFSWEVYARKAQSGQAYMELVIVVRWQEAGRRRSLAVTSLVPTDMAGGAA